MALYLIILNVTCVALVVTGIAGSLLWAIATQQRGWPSRLQTAEVVPEPGALAPAAAASARAPRLATA